MSAYRVAVSRATFDTIRARLIMLGYGVTINDREIKMRDVVFTPETMPTPAQPHAHHGIAWCDGNACTDRPR